MYKNDDKRKLVSFFDSGIGGLNLMGAFHRRHKQVDIAYFADNYNMPYGNLSHSKILEYTEKKFYMISQINPSAAVIACNTVTAECIDVLRSKYSFPIVGIQPAVKPAAATSKRCIVLSTPATAKSAALAALVGKYGGNNTEIIPCPDLAGYIENNIFNLDARVIGQLLPPAECDAVVLGCTHYIFISEIIAATYKCKIFDGVEGTLNNLDKILGIYDHFAQSAGEISFFGGNVQKNYKIFTLLNT